MTKGRSAPARPVAYDAWMTTFARCSCTLPRRDVPSAWVADWADNAPWITFAAGLSCTESITVLHAIHRTGARPIINASS